MIKGQKTENKYLSHLNLNDWAASNPRAVMKSIEYDIIVKDSKTGQVLVEKQQTGGISGTYRVALIGDSTGFMKPDSNYATITISDDGNRITSDWLHNVTRYNRQTGELVATGATHSGGRPSVVRLKFTISGSNITAAGSETRYYKGGIPGVYNVKLTKISN